MRAVDTNVLVRFLTNDDKRQATAARAVFAAGDIYICTTVLLEAEWVLRAAYSFTTDRIAQAFQDLAGLPTIIVEEPSRLTTALGWVRQGMDFADAIHLAKAEECTSFLSFDRKLERVAKGSGAIPVEAPQ